MMQVKSPLTNSENVVLVGSINVKEIIDNYRKVLSHIDPKPLFGDLNSVDIYKCNDTGYQFYWPLHILGDDKYYDKLGKLEWYYSPWKWEHQAASKFVEEGNSVLEVGAAKGDFIKRLKSEKKANVVGLELNPNVEEFSRLNGVPLLNQPIQEYAKHHKNEFDVVCSFQVLEHISEVHPFIQSMIDCLKPGGLLIISVPNNDTSYIKENRMPSKILNMPPHHLGLWTSESLINLQNVFNLKFIEKELEPIQPALYETYVMHRLYKMVKSDFLVKVLWKTKISKLIKPFLLRNKESIVGHSINVYFRKN